MNLINKDKLLKEIQKFRMEHEIGEDRYEYNCKWWYNKAITDIEMLVDTQLLKTKDRTECL